MAITRGMARKKRNGAGSQVGLAIKEVRRAVRRSLDTSQSVAVVRSFYNIERLWKDKKIVSFIQKINFIYELNNIKLYY